MEQKTYLVEIKTKNIKYTLTENATVIIEKNGVTRELETDEAHKKFAKVLLAELYKQRKELVKTLLEKENNIIT